MEGYRVWVLALASLLVLGASALVVTSTLGAAGSPSPAASTPVTPAASCILDESNTPLGWVAGATATISYTLTNCEGGHSLVLYSFTAIYSWGGSITILGNRSLGYPPGSTTYTASVLLPATPGSYSIAFTVLYNDTRLMLTLDDQTWTDTVAFTVDSVMSTSGTSASPSAGDVPLTVAFNGDVSGGTSPYAFAWTFGDGTSSTQQSPSHAYTTTGTFSATFTATDVFGQAVSQTLGVTVNPAVKASASASVTSGVAPLTVSFTGSGSSGTPPYAYSWSFGDGGTGSVASPSHTYTGAGTYTAVLTVTDAGGGSASATPLTITVSGAPAALSASSKANVTSGLAPLSVAFTGSASGGVAPYTYSWNFGDGTTSTTQSPDHTFATAGTYSVVLTVKDSTGAQAVAPTLSISVTSAVGALAATASASVTSGTAPLAVTFTGSATGGTAPYTYSWNFGDGTTSTLQSPSHTYTGAGTYTADLTVTDAASHTAQSVVTITVHTGAGTTGGSSHSTPIPGYVWGAIGAVVAVAVVGVVVYLMVRHRGKAVPTAPSVPGGAPHP